MRYAEAMPPRNSGKTAVKQHCRSHGAGIQPGGTARGHDDGLRPHQNKGGLVFFYIHEHGAAYTPVFGQKIRCGVMVEKGDADFFGLFYQNFLLIMSVVFDVHTRTIRKSMPHIYIVRPEGLHVDAPRVPAVNHFRGPLQKNFGKLSVMPRANLPRQHLVDHFLERYVLNLRHKTQKMIVSRRPGTAATHMGLFRHNC